MPKARLPHDRKPALTESRRTTDRPADRPTGCTPDRWGIYKNAREGFGGFGCVQVLGSGVSGLRLGSGSGGSWPLGPVSGISLLGFRPGGPGFRSGVGFRGAFGLLGLGSGSLRPASKALGCASILKSSAASSSGSAARAKGSTARAKVSTARAKGSAARAKGSTARAKGSTARAKSSAARAKGSAARAKCSAAICQGSAARAKGSAANKPFVTLSLSHYVTVVFCREYPSTGSFQNLTNLYIPWPVRPAAVFSRIICAIRIYSLRPCVPSPCPPN